MELKMEEKSRKRKKWRLVVMVKVRASMNTYSAERRLALLRFALHFTSPHFSLPLTLFRFFPALFLSCLSFSLSSPLLSSPHTGTAVSKWYCDAVRCPAGWKRRRGGSKTLIRLD
uniref:Uncharacterized protein n=1 Tax=Palpitomonas bilix TaxID=652834 RepID=A0A7S3G7W3_9EUKA|mmetsp:Transcript_37355/g.96565  ORF Transcript_37355/g.96565 Transcript_37355/m.96565 type:complete len:115 (+) Transcript_37355:105-449(+)